MIRDKNIEWKRKRLHIDPLVGLGWTTAGTVPVGLHTGAPVFAELGSLGFGAVKFEATGDEWVNTFQLPKDVDVSKPVYMRVLWTTDSTTSTDDATFIVTYKAIGLGEALASADTALNTPIAEDRYGSGTAQVLAATPWGKINGGVLSAGDYLVVETEIDATDATIGSEFIYFLGLEVEYTPKKTVGATGLRNEPGE